MFKQTILFAFFLFTSVASVSQKGITRFGFQYKPILPVEALNVENLQLTNGDFTVNFKQNLGLNIGAIIRWNILQSVSIESGINYTRRNFSYDASVQSTGLTGSANFSMVGYETPIKGLINVQMDRHSFLTVGTGITTSWIASSVASGTTDKNFRQITYAKKLNLALLANVGYEYHTDKSGMFYFGVSFNNPFQAIGLIDAIYEDFNTPKQVISGELLGSYLTLDLRYFFHEKKETKKKKN